MVGRKRPLLSLEEENDPYYTKSDPGREKLPDFIPKVFRTTTTKNLDKYLGRMKSCRLTKVKSNGPQSD